MVDQGAAVRDTALAVPMLTELVRAGLPRMRPEADARQEESYRRVRLALGHARNDRGTVARWTMLAGAGAMAAAAIVLVVRSRPAPLTFTVQGASVSADGSLQAAPHADTKIRFSDGTAVDLERTGRTRVTATTRKGARVVLDHGRARVNVVHRKGAEWTFDAGPYVVQVTGTTFDLQWSKREQKLKVALHTGSVTVSGPAAPRGITLRDGQVLTMNARDGVARVHSLRATPSIDLEEIPGPGLETEPAEMPAAATPRPASRKGPQPRSTAAATGGWAAMVAAGDFRRVLREADRKGVDEAIGRAAVGDLIALADAARFAKRVSLSRRVLLALRSRFPGSSQSHRAAFLLGRMAEDHDRNLAKAIEWYEIYLADAPIGPHFSDALGRKMTATLQLNGAASARPIAEEYLRRFPADAYADGARAIVKSR